MTTAVTELVEQLKAKQADMSDTDFAKVLGMSRTMLALVKNGRRAPGLDFLKAIIKAFPELHLDVYKLMADDDATVGHKKEEREGMPGSPSKVFRSCHGPTGDSSPASRSGYEEREGVFGVA